MALATLPLVGYLNKLCARVQKLSLKAGAID
jgi:hypothetical protein